MSDTVVINTVDETQIANGYVNVGVSVVVSGVSHTPDPFTVNATDPITVVASVQQQAQAYKATIAQALATGASVTSLASLVGDTITLM